MLTWTISCCVLCVKENPGQCLEFTWGNSLRDLSGSKWFWICVIRFFPLISTKALARKLSIFQWKICFSSHFACMIDSLTETRMFQWNAAPDFNIRWWIKSTTCETSVTSWQPTVLTYSFLAFETKVASQLRSCIYEECICRLIVSQHCYKAVWLQSQEMCPFLTAWRVQQADLCG